MEGLDFDTQRRVLKNRLREAVVKQEDAAYMAAVGDPKGASAAEKHRLEAAVIEAELKELAKKETIEIRVQRRLRQDGFIRRFQENVAEIDQALKSREAAFQEALSAIAALSEKVRKYEACSRAALRSRPEGIKDGNGITFSDMIYNDGVRDQLLGSAMVAAGLKSIMKYSSRYDHGFEGVTYTLSRTRERVLGYLEDQLQRIRQEFEAEKHDAPEERSEQ